MVIGINEIINESGSGERPYVPLVFGLCNNFNNFKCIELGTGAGSFLSSIALACKEKGKVYTIDKDGCQSAREKISRFGLSDYVEFLVMDDVSEDAITYFKNFGQVFSLIMIDTSHEHLHTLKELEIYSEFLIKGGYIVLHDSNPQAPYDVRRAIETFLKNDYNPNSNKSDFVWGLDLNGHPPGLTILRRIE